jgi:hypothetical protein
MKLAYIICLQNARFSTVVASKPPISRVNFSHKYLRARGRAQYLMLFLLDLPSRLHLRLITCDGLLCRLLLHLALMRRLCASLQMLCLILQRRSRLALLCLVPKSSSSLRLENSTIQSPQRFVWLLDLAPTVHHWWLPQYLCKGGLISAASPELTRTQCRQNSIEFVRAAHWVAIFRAHPPLIHQLLSNPHKKITICST